MGTGFDCFDSLAHTLDPRVTGRAMDNRLLLKQLMADAGFTNYVNEWWHFSLAGEPYPKTYFDFPWPAALSRAADPVGAARRCGPPGDTATRGCHQPTASSA
jgi:hypothetical protein